MRHAPIFAADPMTMLDQASHGLDTIAGNLDARFLPVGQALLKLVETVDSIVQGLAEVRAALSGSAGAKAVHELTDAAGSLRDTPTRQDQRRTCFVDLKGKVQLLRGLSSELDRVLHVLQFYSLNIKIAAGGDPEFVDFADEMRAQLENGRREITEFDRAVVKLIDQISGMQVVDKELAGECAKLIPAVPDRLAEAARSLLLQQDRIAAIAGQGEATASTIRARIAEALGAIQIGDSARQRIEHVALACRLMSDVPGEDGPGSEARSHIARLCVAHLEAISTDFCDDARRLLGTLNNLLPDTSRLLDSTRNERSVTDSSTLIGRIEDGIAESVDLTSHLRKANTDVAAILGSVLETVESLTTRVERVQDLGIEVGYMSVNANLRCRTNVAISRPVAEIAREIKSHSRLIDAVSSKFVGMSQSLSELSDQIAQVGQIGTLDVKTALEASLGSLREAASRTASGIEKVEFDCGDIAERLRLTAVDLDESIKIAGALDAVRADLALLIEPVDDAALGRADHPVRPILERIHAAYTMACERQIHARFLPPGTVLSPALTIAAAPINAVSDDDLFDDALF